MAGNVLFDVPGPRARARFQVYNVVFGLLAVAVVVGVIYKFDQAGQFESQIYERLFESGTITAITDGLAATLKAAAIAIVTSLVLGTLLAVARLSDHRWVRVPAGLVVEFFRAVPLVLLIIFLFGLIARQLPDWELEAKSLTALVIGLTLYNGAVLCEVFRAGVNAVPKGQREAAYAIGMRKTQVMTIVLAPQAVRFMLPAIISQCVVVLKDTSLGYIVLYPELLRQAKSIATYVGSSLVTYILIALIYVTMNSILSALAYWLERRLSSRGRGTAEAVHEVEEALPVG
jgi:glutamate transport system permease protein